MQPKSCIEPIADKISGKRTYEENYWNCCKCPYLLKLQQIGVFFFGHKSR